MKRIKLEPILVDSPRVPTVFSTFREDGSVRAPDKYDLGRCENCGASDAVVEALSLDDYRLVSDHWDPQDIHLQTKLAALHGVDREHVLLVAGGDGGIRYCFQVFNKKSAAITVGLLRPDFLFSHFAQMVEAQTAILENAQFPFTVPVDEIMRMTREQQPINMIMFSNPNGCLGTKRGHDEIETLVRSAPSVLFVVDEADAIETNSSAFLTAHHDNLVVIRSFSKFYGLAGLRIGYLVVPPWLAEPFRNFIDFLEVGGLAVQGATTVLDDLAYQHETQERVATNLETIRAACEGTRYRIVPGSACFACYLWADESIEDPADMLARYGIKIARGTTFGLPRGGRMSLADPGPIARTAEVIKKHAPR